MGEQEGGETMILFLGEQIGVPQGTLSVNSHVTILSIFVAIPDW
jgi:hypothetical protein